MRALALGAAVADGLARAFEKIIPRLAALRADLVEQLQLPVVADELDGLGALVCRDGDQGKTIGLGAAARVKKNMISSSAALRLQKCG